MDVVGGPAIQRSRQPNCEDRPPRQFQKRIQQTKTHDAARDIPRSGKVLITRRRRRAVSNYVLNSSRRKYLPRRVRRSCVPVITLQKPVGTRLADGRLQERTLHKNKNTDTRGPNVTNKP